MGGGGAGGAGSGATTCTEGGMERPIVVPAAGDLVITEYFGNPAGTDTPAREWLEVLAIRAVDLNGVAVVNMLTDMRRYDVDSPTCVTVAAGDYFVLGGSMDPMATGMTPVDFAVTGGLTLYNSAARIALERGGVVIDAAMVPTSPSGVSLQVSLPNVMDPAANDAATGWCSSTTTGMFEGTGTPSAANIACP
jgi:hypothetical protein